MKKSLRILSVILSALMVMSVLSVIPAFAADTSAVLSGDKSGTTGDCTWSYKESSGKLTISGSGATENVNGKGPFDDFLGQVKSVVVEEGVTVIGDRLFSNMNEISSVSLPTTLTSIKFCAFMNCHKLGAITIPVSVKNIDARAFQYCEKLKNVTIPGGVKEIKDHTFYDCAGLTAVVLPDTLKTIDEFAFVNTGLKELTIPKSVENIVWGSVGYNYNESKNEYTAVQGFKLNYEKGSAAEKYAKDCIPPDTSGITWSFKDGTLTVNGTGESPWARAIHPVSWAKDVSPAPWAEYYDSITKVVFGEGITAVNGVGSPYLKTIVLSDTVETINQFAFQDCECLEEIKFGKGLKVIENQAFNNTGLKSVTFPDSLKKIDEYAFGDCRELSAVKFGNSIEEIGNSAFYNCPIKTVALPDSLKKIGDEAIGYSYEVRGSEGSDEGSFLNAGFEVFANEGTVGAQYANDSQAVLVTGEASINKTSASLKAGETVKLKLKNSGVIRWESSNEKVAVVDGNGKVSALKKGKAVIKPVTPRGLEFSCKVTVKSNPTIKIGKKKFNKKKTYTVKKKGALTVNITGKASVVDNKYKSSNKKVAKVTSKASAKKVKIKGYKKGKATVTLTVNGVKFKIKVKVK